MLQASTHGLCPQISPVSSASSLHLRPPSWPLNPASIPGPYSPNYVSSHPPGPMLRTSTSDSSPSLDSGLKPWPMPPASSFILRTPASNPGFQPRPLPPFPVHGILHRPPPLLSIFSLTSDFIIGLRPSLHTRLSSKTSTPGIQPQPILSVCSMGLSSQHPSVASTHSHLPHCPSPAFTAVSTNGLYLRPQTSVQASSPSLCFQRPTLAYTPGLHPRRQPMPSIHIPNLHPKPPSSSSTSGPLLV